MKATTWSLRTRYGEMPGTSTQISLVKAFCICISNSTVYNNHAMPLKESIAFLCRREQYFNLLQLQQRSGGHMKHRTPAARMAPNAHALSG